MIENDAVKCCYCGGCVGVCPVAAIELFETRIKIDNKKCIDCLACVRVCPVQAMRQVK